MRVLPLRAAALVVLLSTLTAGAAQDVPPKQSPAPEAKPQDETAKVLEKAKRYEKVVTEQRGLAFKNEVKTGLYSKEELVTFLKAEMKREMPPERLAAQEKALKHYGLVPPALDLNSAILSLLGSAIAGFYHPHTKELRLIKGVEGGDMALPVFKDGITLDDITIVHELTHAAQDQTWDLDTLPLDDEENDDLISGLKGLIEGDATIASMKWGLQDAMYDQVMSIMNNTYKQAQLPGEAGDLPAYLRRTVAFGYGYGAEFVQALLKNSNGKWDDVNKAFTSFPMSTEQILHPEKFLAAKRDHPLDVRVKDVDAIAGAGWTRLLTNVHGEFGIYLLLNEFKASENRKKAAEGWGGDRFWLYEAKDGSKAVGSVWMSTWDAESDAEEFFGAYVALLKAKYPEAKEKASQSGLKTSLSGKGVEALVERRGKDVVVLDGGPAAVFADKLDELFKTATKTELTKVERTAPKKG